ncbi:cellulose biosynthesis cyclic di-GMP-binding regulatory protein BcsB [Aeromonas sp. A-5]|uniref:cellulose biosynthesis cyclic di-GMP-binding regulatory protein BcsB n=1 Tax=Aeromonas ichthyocola TaxID=3367746 RepID=UPI0038F25D94
MPPDLYQPGANGIKLQLGYHYTSPVLHDGSRLDVKVNDQLMKSYPLEPDEIKGKQLLTLPLWLTGDDESRALRMPGLKSGQPNRLSFAFQYGQQFMGGHEDGRCDLLLPPAHQVRIDENSTLDFTGYRHLIEMPNLKAFSGIGFPLQQAG